MSNFVESCPTNLTETIAASARLNCGEDQYGNDQYVCLTNAKKTGLVEFCYGGGIPLTQKGFCVETVNRLLYPRNCQDFISGCPSQHYLANEIYRYPACQNINTESQCYFADPSCPNLTTQHSTQGMTETPPTYLSTTEDVPTDIGAVVGGILTGVFVVLLMVLSCVVFRRRNNWNCRTKQVLGSIKEPRSTSGENINLLPENGRNTTPIQIPPCNKQKDYTGKDKQNLLHEACRNGKLEMCQHLIQTNPNLLHSISNNGWNAALHAARGGNVEILKLLADKEVDVKHKNNEGWNILHVACLNSNLDMSRYIIQTYPDLLHSVDNDGCNAALHAARGGNVEILQLVADNRVDVKHKNNYGWNTLNVACVHSNLEMSRYIIQTNPDLLHRVDNDGWNAALHAARGGNVEILQLLADKEVDVKHKSNNGGNILDVACHNSNLDMSRYMIQTYPDLLHSVDNDGWNAALHAARGGNVEILQLVADNRVDVKHKNNYGWNILNVACLFAYLEMSRSIIQTYPDLLHSVDNYGWNAALHAARGGNVEILQLLADNKVDVKHKSNNGWNILHVACQYLNLRMSRYIIQTYPDLLHSVDNDGWNAALHAARGGNVEILQLLADKEVDVKHKDNDGQNILHVACGYANLEMSRYIFQTYPDLIHSVDNDGRNAASYAASGGNVEILRLLT